MELVVTYFANAYDFQQPKPGDAGYDLRATAPFVLFKGHQVKIPVGIGVQIPDGYVGIIKDRSSMASKQLYTSGGVIDSSYRGEIKVLLRNDSDQVYQVKAGDKIAQLLIIPCITPPILVVDNLDETERGDQGFGSTGR